MDYLKFREIIVNTPALCKTAYSGLFGNFVKKTFSTEVSTGLVGDSLLNLKPVFSFGYFSPIPFSYSYLFNRPTNMFPLNNSLLFRPLQSPFLIRPYNNSILESAKRLARADLKLTNPMNNVKNLRDLQALGYNQSKGQRLFNDAYRHMDGHWKQHDCKKHVREASERCGLGTITGGNGVKSLASLRRNPNYREVPASSMDLNNIPAGTIGIFKPNSQGYSRTDGHTEIYGYVNGKLKGVSNYVTNNVKKADYYFIPV